MEYYNLIHFAIQLFYRKYAFKMGCTFDTSVNYHDQELKHTKINQRGRLKSIDARKRLSQLGQRFTQNIIQYSKQPLTNEQMGFAVKCLQNSSIFDALPNQQLRIISKCLISVVFKAGSYVFKQDDIGYCFFLIEKGSLEVQIDGRMIKSLSKGQCFGELAMILKTKRTASIKTKQKCSLLIMEQKIFKSTMQSMKSKQYQIKRNSLDYVQIFEGLTNKQKLALANAFKIMKYQKDDRIFSQNQLAIAFYIIHEGKVSINFQNQQSVIMSQNQYFGESVFKQKGRRKGNAIAIQNTTCLMISRQDFQKHSGSKPQCIYFYSIKKWALQNSIAFKNETKQNLTKINLAFQTNQAKAKSIIKNKGLIICLQGKIKGFKQGQTIYGQTQWLQKTQKFNELKQKQKGFYAFLPFHKLTNLIKDFQQTPKQSQSKKIDKKIDISQFDFIKNLGQGKFGTVKLIRDKSMDRLYALKQISKKLILQQGIQKYVQQERTILQQIEFPYIVGFVKAFSDHQNVYFLMQYVKGMEMFSVIRQLPVFNKPVIRYFFSSLLLSIEHLHQRSIIYRDLKPENSILNDRGRVILIDLGSAKLLTKEKFFKTYTVIGTPHYMAPEIFLAQGYSFQADLWSLGVILFQLICQRLPFGQEEMDVFKVMESITNLDIKYPKDIEPQAQELLKMILIKNPVQRTTATFQKIKQSAFYKDFKWQQMLNEKILPPYIPQAIVKQNQMTIRMSGQSILKHLHPKIYGDKQPIVFREWDENISF